MTATIDVICPVYREEDAIALFHKRLTAAIASLRSRYVIRVLYVVDPSADNTEPALAAISASDADVKVIVMSRRFGHQAALIAGIEESEADAILMLDSDLQHPPELIPQLVAHWENGADIVQTVREDGAEIPYVKRVTSRWFYRVLLRLGNVDLPVGGTDYRLISRRVSGLFKSQLREQNPFLRGLVGWVGFKCVRVPFTPAARLHGRSNYSPSALINFALNGICSFSKTPLRICTIAGLIVAFLSIAGGIVQVFVYILSRADVPGWPTLVLFMSFIAGIQLFFLGVLGEYLGLIFDEVKSRPRYIIDRYIEHGRYQLAETSESRRKAPQQRAASETVTGR